MRVPDRKRGLGSGSLRALQELVKRHELALDPKIRAALGLPANLQIEWRSPLSTDEYAEYRDADFLKMIGCEHLAPDLKQFWPTRGPQWDGLATAKGGHVFLIEAKAQLDEMKSSCTAGPKSRVQIVAALANAQKAYGATKTGWTTDFYQYANRLAHLHFLRSNGVPNAHLLFVYFLNAKHVKEPPRSEGDWRLKIDGCYKALGLSSANPPPGVHTLYFDLAALGIPST